MENLDSLRKEVDRLDDLMKPLLLKRMECVRQIGKIKKQENIPVVSVAREMEIFERLTEGLRGDESYYIRQIYQEIFRATHNVEEEA